MLSPDQLTAFERDGFLRVSGAFSREAARAMEDRIWTALQRKFDVCREDPATWKLPLGLGLQRLKKERVFAPIGDEKTLEALDDLLGPDRWVRPEHWGQFLVSFPNPEAGPWTVPSGWHTDFPYIAPRDRVFGALVFSFLSEVPARHGGTVVVAGSHRVIRRFIDARPKLTSQKMKVVRKALMHSDPWLRALSTDGEDDVDRERGDRIDRFMRAEHTIADIAVRVVELTGEPGDLVIGHPWLLHSGAANCGERPRFMSVQRVRPC